jgi:SAM-dependent methyltransferase
MSGIAEMRDRLADLEHLLLRNIVCPLKVSTKHPVAIHSEDHRQPRGTKNDNTRHPRFVRRTEEIFKSAIVYHMDLGCAGGGLVLDFILKGHVSVGIEGSDYSLKERRAEWRVIPNHLFTADVTEPYDVQTHDGAPVQFDVISAWELLEHLPESRLPRFFDNVRRHLKPGGIFVASVATFEDRDPATGAVWHVTVKPKDWWLDRIAEAGLVVINSPYRHRDFPRGSGNPRVGPLGKSDWDASRDPQLGFHLCAALHRLKFSSTD